MDGAKSVFRVFQERLPGADSLQVMKISLSTDYKVPKQLFDASSEECPEQPDSRFLGTFANQATKKTKVHHVGTCYTAGLRVVRNTKCTLVVILVTRQAIALSVRKNFGYRVGTACKFSVDVRVTLYHVIVSYHSFYVTLVSLIFVSFDFLR